MPTAQNCSNLATIMKYRERSWNIMKCDETWRHWSWTVEHVLNNLCTNLTCISLNGSVCIVFAKVIDIHRFYLEAGNRKTVRAFSCANVRLSELWSVSGQRTGFGSWFIPIRRTCCEMVFEETELTRTKCGCSFGPR
jgi:hypothetical protein